ncbi:hypothetical protein RHSIM_Rhsim03G0023900 [Rhododendron simsii]|uniref:tRNA-uridine aminocarboxypropyltransferase n=1 Tax=Rhododendron simsii TaxID=118357 RepID=A0A834H4S8_RHOSS|nr:hypothetical protein RHSIM_Rhsim03G0023900 [Rhododendron simsii]
MIGDLALTMMIISLSGTDSSPAIDISKCQCSLRGSYISKYVLIAFDGTWKLTKEMEPFSGCMSTMEAIARALCVLDPHGVEIEGRLVEVLRAMVRFQACYLKPLKPRPKLLKRGKEDEKKNQSAVILPKERSPVEHFYSFLLQPIIAQAKNDNHCNQRWLSFVFIGK